MSLASVCPSVRPYVNILCPLINLKTVWTNLMILQSYLEQVMTMCRAQKMRALALLLLELPLEYYHDTS